MIVRIDDPHDPRLAEYRHIPDPVLLRERGLFAAEGRLVVRRLLTRSPYRTRSILVTATALASIADVRGDTPTWVVPQQVMNEVGGFNFHRGCLALGERPPGRSTADLLAALPPPSRPLERPGPEATAGTPPLFVVVLEGVGNVDNVGAIFRNAAAFGAAFVLLGPGCGDPLYRKAIRTSMGAALWLPFGVAIAWPEDLAQLRDAGFFLVALTPRRDAATVTALDAEVARRPRVALLLGSEGAGLSAAALALADLCVRIPIVPDVDSLNVATAAAIALHRLAGDEPRRPGPGGTGA